MNRYSKTSLWIMALQIATLVVSPGPTSAWASSDSYSFPADHQPHKEAQGELWSLWLLVETREGNQLGIQLRLGRLAPGDQGKSIDSNPSKWAIERVFALSAAVTDISSGQFYPMRSQARDALGLAGNDYEFKNHKTVGQVWVNQHSLKVEASSRCTLDLSLVLNTLARPLSLSLQNTGCPLQRNGDLAGPVRGYSQHLQLLQGSWAGTPLVAGHGWLERTWGEVAQAFGAGTATAFPGASEEQQQAPVVVDQFRVFLPEKELLVITRTRRRDGSGTAVLSANLLGKRTSTALDYRKLQVKDTANWRSIASTQSYSSGWEVSWGNYSWTITPVVEAQELSIGGVNRWSGLAGVASAASNVASGLWSYIDLAAGGRARQ